MDTDGVEIPANIVIQAYKRKVAELQDQVIMLQAYLAQMTSDNTDTDQ